MSLKQYNNYTVGGSNPTAPSQNNIDPATGLAIGSWVLEKGIEAGQNRKDREFQERMTKEQWAEDQRRWELQNAYNTPAMMMQRYKQAGLNPALMYKGTATPAGAMPKAEKQTGKFGLGQSQLQAAQVMLQARMQKAQIDNLNANTQSTLANIPNIGKQGAQIDQQIENLKTQNLGQEKINEINEIKRKVDAQLQERLETTGVAPHDPFFAKMAAEVFSRVLNFLDDAKSGPKVTMDTIRQEFGQQEINNLTPNELRLLKEMINAQQ